MSREEAIARLENLRDNLIGAMNKEMRKDRDALTLALELLKGSDGQSVRPAG